MGPSGQDMAVEFVSYQSQGAIDDLEFRTDCCCSTKGQSKRAALLRCLVRLSCQTSGRVIRPRSLGIGAEWLHSFCGEVTRLLLLGRNPAKMALFSPDKTDATACVSASQRQPPGFCFSCNTGFFFQCSRPYHIPIQVKIRDRIEGEPEQRTAFKPKQGTALSRLTPI